DPHPVTRCLLREDRRQRRNPRLGRPVIRLSDLADEAGGGGDVDDGGVRLSPLLRLRPPVPGKDPAGGERCLELPFDDGVPLLLGHIREHPVAQRTGIVDEPVYAAVGIDGEVKQFLSPGHRAHVGGRSDGLPACGVDLVDYVRGEAEVLPGTGEFGADIVDDDAGSLPCRQQGVGATESPARTGDDHYAVLECIHDHSFVCSSAGRTRVYAAPNPLRVSVASATTLSMSSLTVGTSSIIPTTWPEAMMPTSALPSSRAVR